MRKLSVAVAALATLALVAVDDAWSAGHRGGGRSGFAAGGASRAGFAFRSARPLPPGMVSQPPHFHHGGRAVIFVGAPFYYWSWPYGYYYAPPPYYYGPDYVAREELPPVYVERFDGTPTAETPGEIFCPGSEAYFPDVQQCPSGWQRIFREQEDAEPWDAG